MQDYLQWRSKLSLPEVFSADELLAYPGYIGNSVVFLTTTQPKVTETKSVSKDNKEKARFVLMLIDDNGGYCLTPDPFSLRTSINEYGGKPYWLYDDHLIFANQDDQCLYRQSCTEGRIGDPQRVSPLPSTDQRFMYSDVMAIDSRRYLAIVEHFSASRGAEKNHCFIGLIDADRPDVEPVQLVSGADFYSNLALGADGRLAWVQWNHPMMPWDDNQLFVARIEGGGSEPHRVRQIEEVNACANCRGASHCQLAFDQQGVLYFSVDFRGVCDDSKAGRARNFWNVYVFESGEARPLSQLQFEFGYPHWQYGDVRIVPACVATTEETGSMLAVGSDVLGDRLFLLNAKQGSCLEVYTQGSTIQHLACAGTGAFLAIEIDGLGRPKLSKFTLDGQGLTRRDVRAPAPYKYPVSRAQAIEYPTQDQQTAYGFYYAPVNQCGESEQANKAPPLIVMVHGGPTARAYGHFDIQKQFWAANGFAIFDVNHRGSSGYGRAYRDALYGNWGQLDTRDIVDGIDSLVAQGLADPERICIRGKSAGGYAVLRALTEYPKIFKAGACYYGIGNLATLSELTHKFEKHYTDRLIDEPYDSATASNADSRYFSRSPIHKIGMVESAMIVFQGGADKVVPPKVAHEVVNSLARNNIVHQYVEYPDEGHGFRDVRNNIDAWSKELEFYRSALSGEQ